MDEGALTFGEWLQRRRQRLHLTQAHLAHLLGYSTSMVRKIEADVRRPAPGSLVALADGLQIPASLRPAFYDFAAGADVLLPLELRADAADGQTPSRPAPPPSTVPVAPNALIGREVDIARLRRLLAQPDVRLVTLIGPGGVGKTRVALAVAAALWNAFADGVTFVDLSAVRDHTLVATTVAQALDVQEQAGRSTRDRIVMKIANEQCLLVFDNFEQVIEAALLIADLLRACPRLQVLVTSRIPLHIQGEHVFSVPVLDLPALDEQVTLPTAVTYGAVQLFLERARAAQPDFTITEDNYQTVIELCRRLDGLPLALELAAARVHVLGPTLLAQQLAQRFRVLTNGFRDLPLRQQTLRHTMDWSYQLLSSDTQRLFRRLGVFGGDWTVAAVEAVCNPEGDLDVMEGLTTLIHHSLVQVTGARQGPTASKPDDEQRFSMLETIREYAAEHLAQRSVHYLMGERHAHFYLQLAEDADVHARGSEQAAWLHRIAVHYDNFRAALTWSRNAGAVDILLRFVGALWLFWGVRGSATEGYAWTMQALEMSQTLRTFPRMKTLYAAGWLARHHRELTQAAQFHTEALALARELNEREWVGECLHNLAIVAVMEAKWEEAKNLQQESEAHFRDLQLPWHLAWSISNRGNLALAQGEYQRASADFEESLALMRAVGDSHGVAWQLRRLGVAMMNWGDVVRPWALLEESVALFRELGEHLGTASVYSDLASLALKRGDVTQAIMHYERSLALAITIDAAILIESVRSGLAECARQQFRTGDNTQ